MTASELVFARARRDSGGRVNGVSPLYPRDIVEVYLAQSREPEQAASDTDRLFARPAEFAALPEARLALSSWIDWHTERITAHDGKVRANHPLLLQALDRRQSASSLAKLLRDPLGYLWQYGFGWSSPDEIDEPLTLDPLQFGNLLHEILEGAILILEGKPGGFAAAAQDEQALKNVIGAATASVATRWDSTAPVPPPVIWRRKCQDASELALTALSANEAPLVGQRSFAEIPFGGDSRALDMGDNVLATLPWNPRTPVVIPGTGISIGGSIDRLDLAGDNSAARVTDYKSGKFPRGVPQLKGGAELQRCLYAYAVRSLIVGSPEVDARLLYPRKNGALLNLASPDATLTKLTAFLAAAYSAFAAGKALPGPGAAEDFNDFAFALPGGAKESYVDLIRPLVAAELSDLAPLWEEP
nr:PD-(D/E)XK nuclease family protein [Candidatus Rhodoblastus alkanivorans]